MCIDLNRTLVKLNLSQYSPRFVVEKESGEKAENQAIYPLYPYPVETSSLKIEERQRTESMMADQLSEPVIEQHHLRTTTKVDCKPDVTTQATK